MLGTRNNAKVKIYEYVKIAGGDAYLVYRALSELPKLSDQAIKDFISKHSPKE